MKLEKRDYVVLADDGKAFKGTVAAGNRAADFHIYKRDIERLEGLAKNNKDRFYAGLINLVQNDVTVCANVLIDGG